MENGVGYSIAAGHCSRTIIPWKVSVRTDRGIYFVGEEDIHANDSLLVSGHRLYLSSGLANPGINRLSDCVGYSMATSSGWLSSLGIVEIPRSEVIVDGDGADDAVYHVKSVYQLVESLQSGQVGPASNPGWLQWGPEVNCREVLAMERESACSMGFDGACSPAPVALPHR
jgi:hypothetical protein